MKPIEQPKFDLSLYNDEFFAWHLTHVHESSVKCMEWYCEQYSPMGVFDIGCGIGSYILGAINKGVYARGIEISEAAKPYTDNRILPLIRYVDAIGGRVITTNQDHIICLEVAEHIEPDNSEVLIELLSVGQRILFSAAPIGQGGCGHINEQPREFWLDLFAKFNRHPLESTTEHIARNWQKLGAPDYICKNLIVL